MRYNRILRRNTRCFMNDRMTSHRAVLLPFLSKSAIAEHLSGDMADMLDNHDFVYAHIKNLKNKMKDAGCSDYIKTVYGLGYKWQND